jgi:hypothetical protein
VGLLNAAVWFGSGIYFTFFAGAVPFSAGMKELLGPNNFPYFSGAIAQIFIARYFLLQLICAIIAVVHLWAERLYFGRVPEKRWVGLSLLILGLILAGKYWLQPRMHALHTFKYAVNVSEPARAAAAHAFIILHVFAQIINLAILIALGIYLWRVANRKDPGHFITASRFSR